MLELIVRIARAIACQSRLRILSCLVRKEEMKPGELADELGMPKSLVSDHLRILTSVGLVQSRRSGVWCYYRAESPYDDDSLSGGLARWLRECLVGRARTAENCRVRELCNSLPAGPEESVRELIFEAATAFTNVRRVQLLRFLAVTGPAEAHTLAAELGMSDASVSRHLSKLARRGYVASRRDGRELTHSLADGFRSPIHEGLFQIVSAAWGDA